MSTTSGDYTALVPVTGEAVALDLRLAQFPSRTLGLALDLLVQGVALTVVVWFAAAVAGEVDTAASSAIMLVAVVSILVGLPTLIETLTRGRSLGKLANGTRVVRDDGGPVRFRHSFVRALFMLVDFWLTSGSVGLVSSLVSTNGKRLGDHFAGTVVVRERVPAAAMVRQQTYLIPPALEPWAASLDLARLPDVTALAARQFLTRTPTLAPEVRSAMGQQLAAEMATYIAPPPPQGVPAELFLQTVLTERMRRATRRTPAAAFVGAGMPAATSAAASTTATPTHAQPSTGDDGFTAPR